MNEKFVNTQAENLLFQHVTAPARQHGLDEPHTLDLVIISDNFLPEVENLSTFSVV